MEIVIHAATDNGATSYRHIHDCLISLNQSIAHCHSSLQRNLGLGDRRDDVSEVTLPHQARMSRSFGCCTLVNC